MLTRSAFLQLSAAIIASAATPARAAASSVESFYRGRTITLIIPTAPGGINNLSGRLVAKHLGHFIPGNPTITAANREQGGGLALANSFMNGAVKDGSVIAVIQRGIAQLAIQGNKNAK